MIAGVNSGCEPYSSSVSESEPDFVFSSLLDSSIGLRPGRILSLAPSLLLEAESPPGETDADATGAKTGVARAEFTLLAGVGAKASDKRRLCRRR